MRDSKNIILMGPPASGKGTQAKLLLEKFKNHYYISTGELFRNLIDKNTDVGQRVKDVVESGGLPFDNLATTLWMHEIAFNVKKDQGIIADGFPRRLQEAKDLDGFLKFLNRDILFFLIEISEEEARKRLAKRGRKDDNPEDITRRFKMYRKRTIPALKYFRKKLIKINGEQSIENVFKDILSKLPT